MTDRRPLASRQTRWAADLTRRLAATSITPNQISIASMGFAALAGGAFWWAGDAHWLGRVVLLILGAAFVQLRLLCNLLDGMVAVEAGRGSPDGKFWNEAPDRVADMLILVGAGLGVGLPGLGWAAAAFAILTAYIRELGASAGLGSDFSGPMAKPHRMALITGAALLSLFEPIWHGQGDVLTLGLWIVVIGAAVTALRRSVRVIQGLKRLR
ncbi:MAG: CDP-diacylglycerol--glycerol-3-phosphate 3-phosphatidyltransferase [Paracoccus denitrificans]|nr:MAG: CDP-diacylglycerol--glycerol-3-phosphate 3-phosphatidyltransferase [Paracoccus denitrificans]PZO85496.1 MAG: CDP-diacylglycerol--glycerol-3-phosphate 3-phosphatidyltransferase [Paracoccus denitrificans]